MHALHMCSGFSDTIPQLSAALLYFNKIHTRHLKWNCWCYWTDSVLLTCGETELRSLYSYMLLLMRLHCYQLICSQHCSELNRIWNILFYHERGVSMQHIRTVISNCTSLFTHLLLLFVCPSVPFLLRDVSFVWSRLVRWCVQALNILGVPHCFASFSVCVFLCPGPGVSLDGLSRYSINMFPLILPAVLVVQRQALSSYTGNSRNGLYCIVWICCCLALCPHLGSHILLLWVN